MPSLATNRSILSAHPLLKSADIVDVRNFKWLARLIGCARYRQSSGKGNPSSRRPSARGCSHRSGKYRSVLLIRVESGYGDNAIRWPTRFPINVAQKTLLRQRASCDRPRFGARRHQQPVAAIGRTIATSVQSRGMAACFRDQKYSRYMAPRQGSPIEQKSPMTPYEPGIIDSGGATAEYVRPGSVRTPFQFRLKLGREKSRFDNPRGRLRATVYTNPNGLTVNVGAAGFALCAFTRTRRHRRECLTSGETRWLR